MEWEHRKQMAHDRMNICKQCESFNATTTQCKECGCVMIAKTLIAGATCPLDKWKKETEIQPTK